MKILIVDDQKFNRDLLGFILDDFGYDHVEAINGRDACHYLEENGDIDLILMDINMPVMDGYEATQKIKAMGEAHLQPVIFVTALDNSETLTKCLAAGGDDFIAKPVNESVLIAKLKAHQRTIELYRKLQQSNKQLEHHHRMMDRDHGLVEHMFDNNMKRLDSSCRNINFKVSPMSMFNGDLLLTARSPSGSLYTLLGDFTGHGLAAAIGSLPTSDIFFTMTAKQLCVSEIAAEINSRLHWLLPDNMFFCATLIELSPEGDRLVIWSGGMNDLLLLNADGEIETRIQAQHMPMAILDRDEFDNNVQIVRPSPAAHLYAYTDGVIETVNANGELFGEQRLESALLHSNDSRFENKVASVFKELDNFRGGTDQDDDTSMLEILCSPIIQSGSNELQDCSPTGSQRKEKYLAIPFHVRVNLDPESVRSSNTVPQLLQFLDCIPGISDHRRIIYTLLTELYNNAVDHGLLSMKSELKQSPEGFVAYSEQRLQRLSELSEGEIVIQLDIKPQDANTPAQLIARFTDSGPGFDYDKLLEQPIDDDKAYGRGIELVKSLCQRMVFSNQGRTVDVTYCL